MFERLTDDSLCEDDVSHILSTSTSLYLSLFLFISLSFSLSSPFCLSLLLDASPYNYECIKLFSYPSISLSTYLFIIQSRNIPSCFYHTISSSFSLLWTINLPIYLPCHIPFFCSSFLPSFHSFFPSFKYFLRFIPFSIVTHSKSYYNFSIPSTPLCFQEGGRDGIEKYMKDLSQMMDGMLDLNRRNQLPDRERAICLKLLLRITLKVHQPYPILSFPIQPFSIISCLIPSSLILSNPLLFYPTSSHNIISYLTNHVIFFPIFLSYLVSSYLILSYLIAPSALLFYPPTPFYSLLLFLTISPSIRSYPILCYLVLSCRISLRSLLIHLTAAIIYDFYK